jgi:endonuclease YncB( thermonuclease family)
VQIGRIQLLLLAALLVACEPFDSQAFGGAISGRAEVIDGDSLEISGVSIRLFGVDAFEGRQTCSRNAVAWRCGEAATRKLEDLVGSATIACEERDIDSYGRTVAACRNGKVDLSAELALAGLALAYRQYSTDYVDEEAEAEAAGRGAWAGSFDAPWDWRRSDRDSAESPSGGSAAPPASGNCLIKGNINSEGERIYHLPGGSYYDATIIDASRGERWFCSEAEAVAAGWRASRAG